MDVECSLHGNLHGEWVLRRVFAIKVVLVDLARNGGVGRLTGRRDSNSILCLSDHHSESILVELEIKLLRNRPASHVGELYTESKLLLLVLEEASLHLKPSLAFLASLRRVQDNCGLRCRKVDREG